MIGDWSELVRLRGSQSEVPIAALDLLERRSRRWRLDLQTANDAATGQEALTCDQRSATTLVQSVVIDPSVPAVFEFVAVLAEALQIADAVGPTLRSWHSVVSVYPGKPDPLPTRCASTAMQLKHGPPFFRLHPFVGPAIRSRHLFLKPESFTEFFGFSGLSRGISLAPSIWRVRIDLLQELGNFGDPRPFDKSGYFADAFAERWHLGQIFDIFSYLELEHTIVIQFRSECSVSGNALCAALFGR